MRQRRTHTFNPWHTGTQIYSTHTVHLFSLFKWFLSFLPLVSHVFPSPPHPPLSFSLDLCISTISVSSARDGGGRNAGHQDSITLTFISSIHSVHNDSLFFLLTSSTRHHPSLPPSLLPLAPGSLLPISSISLLWLTKG